jgi:alpha-amylase/alpha-mannosidase (GH57 family)
MVKLIEYNKCYSNEIDRLRNLQAEKYKNFTKDKFDDPVNNVSASIIANDGLVVGAGFLHIIPEAILILDPRLPKYIKGEAVDIALKEAKKQAILAKFDGITAFTYNDENFNQVLVHRYGFCDAGTAFYLEL